MGILSARVRASGGWAVRGAVLIVTDPLGQQSARADGDEDGVVTSQELPPGTYTAVVTAPGYQPVARTAVVTASGAASLGTLTLARAANVPLPAPGRWTIDPAHSSVRITARHMGVASVTGFLTEVSGGIEITEPPENSSVRAVMQAASVDTGNKARDDHLRSPDFLDVAAYPVIEYAGTGVTSQGDDRWTVTGRLTLRGTRRDIPLELTYLGTTADPWGGERAAFRATAELRRHDFQMTWNQSLPAGGVMVGSVLQITIDTEAVHGDLPDYPDA
ncbi:MAG TPA: YceI family protein [Trebonia sp.]|nr:YceI family protein [Trebonia sp.]